MNRFLIMAAGVCALLPATALANAGASCTPAGDVEVRLENFVAGRTITATVVVGGVSRTVRFVGPSTTTLFAGPFTAPWSGSATWSGYRSVPVVVPLSGPACITPPPVTPPPTPPPPVAPPAPPVEPPVVPPVVTIPPVVVTPPPVVTPPVVVQRKPPVRRWKPIRCTPKRAWGRKPNGVVYRCHRPRPRVPAVTG